uniref:Uncharacterized protein n=1 Tax=Oryza sativa subsp. japonica TaxID=39947 RepID=Q6H4P1_ORYSJ|nr:hypothetical protein [Oryza sativa Japonica Group]BAD26308.1 hypothetical protein [Oryza sativa Japonica Group]
MKAHKHTLPNAEIGSHYYRREGPATATTRPVALSRGRRGRRTSRAVPAFLLPSPASPPPEPPPAKPGGCKDGGGGALSPSLAAKTVRTLARHELRAWRRRRPDPVPWRLDPVPWWPDPVPQRRAAAS